MKRAIDAWGERNIKEIGYAEIEDFLTSQRLEGSDEFVSDKTRSNMKSALHGFWTWLRKRKVLQAQQMPEFPEISFELGFRSTVDKSTQEALLEEVRQISYQIDPKVWLGIKWLCTYIAIRPGEMLDVRERDIDLENGYITIPHPKEKKPKFVPLLEEDIELLRNIPQGFPDQPFFRHPKGLRGCSEGSRYGNRYFYKWWKKACRNLGVEGVDLYGGTRHSSAMALRQYRTPEEIKKATMHSTNKAFERYFQMGTEDIREIYGDTRATVKKQTNALNFEPRKVIKE